MKLKHLFAVVAAFTTVGMANAGDGHKDIVDTAVGAGKFKTLTTLVGQAGLVDVLKGDGPFTVFAPTDEAFAKLPKPLVQRLVNDKELLKSVLLYHVVAGKVTSGDVVQLKSAKTVNGAEVKVKVNKNKVMIDQSKVVTVDVMASNGVIHVIDTVLIPPKLRKH